MTEIKAQTINKKTTVPIEEKVALYLPLSFWSKILITLDRKIHSMADMYGYGSVSMQVVIRKGAIKDIVFNDEVRVRDERPIADVKEKT